jgi:hypothetical protein
MLLHHIIIESQNRDMGPAINLQYALENFSAEILNNLNIMKSMLTGCLTLNFISTKFKELIAEKHREGFSCIKILTIYMSSFLTFFTDMVNTW